VVAWLESVANEDLHLSAVTLGELQAGVEITREQDPGKASEIETWIDPVAHTLERPSPRRADLPRLGQAHASPS
jgi:predicted nucleic acid-binding protein